MRFRLFDYTDCPEGPVLPGAHSIERYLIEEHLHNIVKEYHQERKQWWADDRFNKLPSVEFIYFYYYDYFFSAHVIPVTY